MRRAEIRCRACAIRWLPATNRGIASAQRCIVLLAEQSCMPTDNCRNSKILLWGSPDGAGEPGWCSYGRRGPRGQSRTILVALAAIAASGLRAGYAAADEAEFPASLRYHVDSSLGGCWDEAEFRQKIARRVGYDPFRENASANVLVHVGGSARAIGGQVEWRNAKGTSMGERWFVAKDGNCAKLLAEMSFAVGLQIELLRPKASAGSESNPYAETGSDGGTPAAAAAAEPPSSPAPSPSPPSPPAPAPPAAPPEPDHVMSVKDRRPSEDVAPAASGAAPHWSMWVGLGPSLAWGISPSTAANARLFLGIRRNDLSGEVGAETSYPSSARKWGGSGFRELLISGSAGACGHHGVLAACLLGKAGQLRARGLGLDQPRSPTAFVAQIGLRLAAGLALGSSWLVTAHLDALVLLTPCTVDLNDVGVWQMPRLSAFAGVDLSARFW